MSGVHTFPGTPRPRKRMSLRGFVSLGIGIFLCVLTGYQIGTYQYSGQRPVLDDGATVAPSLGQPEGPHNPGGAEAPDGEARELDGRRRMSAAKRAADETLRSSEYCTNNCNVSDIYGRRWLEARIDENAKIFRATEDPDDPFGESVETNVVSKDFRVVIKVLAFNRLESLARCLLSLARADYGGDSVNIQIFLDHFPLDDARAKPESENSTLASEEVGEEPATAAEPEEVAPSQEVADGAGRVDERGRRLLWGFHFGGPGVTTEREGEGPSATRSVNASAGMETAVVSPRLRNSIPEDETLVPKAAHEGGEELRHVVGTKRKSATQMEGNSHDSETEPSRHEESEAELDAEKMAVKSAVEDPLAGGEFTKLQAKRQPAPRKPEVKSLNAELAKAHAILRFVDAFWWAHGTKEVHYRSRNAGLQAQWVEAWWPANNDEFAFIVEDDMEVSNLYYRFLRGVVATYYYNPEHYDPSLYGISLQRPRFVPGREGSPLRVNSTKNLFMYPMVGTWGQLLFPQQWREFRLWYDVRKSKGEKPFLEGMKTNSWYKKLGERIWTPWFVKFVHARGYVNFYTNFADARALSVSHREPGVNYRRSPGPDARLVYTLEEGNDTMLWVMSPPQSLRRFDYCFREVTVRPLARTLPELKDILLSTEVRKAILLVNIVGVPERLVRNWLCHSERLGLRNFVLLGDDDALTGDLARRGLATMSTQVFTDPLRGSAELRRDPVAVQAVHGILGLGYSVWLTRADTVWVHDPRVATVVADVETGEADFAGSEPLDGFHPALLYIKASQGVLRVWGELVKNVASPIAADDPTKLSVWPGFPEFVSTQKNCRYQALPSNLFDGFEALGANSTATATESSVVLLDGVVGGARRRPTDVVHRLKAAGLWAVDKDLACKRVFCQPEG